MTKRSRLGLIRDLVLSLTALVGAVCLVLVLAGLAFGVHPLLFRSGSMSPAIRTGDLALARTVDAGGLKSGDIVSVIATGGQRVTHRVVSATDQGGGVAQLQLKGDANKTPDTQVYDVKSAEKVFLRIPKAGYVVSWFSHAPGSFVLAGYVALMLLLMLRRRPSRDNDEARADVPAQAATPVPALARTAPVTDEAPAPKRPLKAAAIAGGFALGLAALAGWGHSTGAFWTDSVAVTGTSFTAGTTGWPLPAPTFGASPCSGAGGKSVKITWNAVAGANHYVLTIIPSGGSAQSPAPTTTATNYTITTGSAQQTGTFQVQAVDGSGNVGAVSVTLHYTTATGSGSSWSCS